MPRKTPWMPLWTADWLSCPHVRRMNASELGLYISMLVQQWEYGAVPDDPDEVARLCCLSGKDVAASWVSVRARFDLAPDGLVNAKCAKQKRRAKNGNLGRDARSDAQTDAGSDDKNDSPSDASDSLEARDALDAPEASDFGAPKRKRKPPIDGAAELARALEACAWATPEVDAAAEEYRRERITARFPVWPEAKWAKVFEDSRENPSAAACALSTATQGPNRSVHPKPAQASTARRRDDPQGRRFLDAMCNPRPKTVDATGRAV